MGPGRVWITGASGMVAPAVRAALPLDEPVGLVTHRHDAQGARPGDAVERVDLRTPGAAARWVERVRPAVVIHAAADSSLERCEQSPQQTRRLNVDVPAELAVACRGLNTYFVHCSTDQVFDGTAAPYAESAQPAPLTEYGRQKAESEARVLGTDADAVVLRIALVLGRTASRDRGPIDMLRPREGVARTVGLFEDEWRTPIVSTCLGRLVAACVQRRVRGVVNAGGDERLDRVALGRRVAEAFGWPLEIEARSRTVMPYPRPRDTSLRLEQRDDLGLPRPARLDDALGELVAAS